MFVESATEGPFEVVLAFLCFEGLGNSRGPLGTLAFSLWSVLLLLYCWLRLGWRSSPTAAAVRVAEAGIDGLRKTALSEAAFRLGSVVVVRWNLRRTRLESAVQGALVYFPHGAVLSD